jgi:hypothetical protein
MSRPRAARVIFWPSAHLRQQARSRRARPGSPSQRSRQLGAMRRLGVVAENCRPRRCRRRVRARRAPRRRRRARRRAIPGPRAVPQREDRGPGRSRVPLAPDRTLAAESSRTDTPADDVDQRLQDFPLDPFRSVRDLGCVPACCSYSSGFPECCSPRWLPAWLPRMRVHGSRGRQLHLANLCGLPARTRSPRSRAARIIPRIFRIMIGRAFRASANGRTYSKLARIVRELCPSWANLVRT